MDEQLKEKSEEEKANEEKRKQYEFSKSSEWKAVKKVLIEKIMFADSCSLLDDNLSVQQAGEQALVNKKAVKLITAWIQEIEGNADLYMQMVNQDIPNEKKENLIFKKVEE